MPIYEYKCKKCGNVDELLMRISDPAPEGCTKCGGGVEKLLSQTSFALKGEGWYVTDYKPKSAAAETAAGPDSPSATEGGKEPATPAAATPSATPAAPAPAAGTSNAAAPAASPAPIAKPKSD